MTYQPWRFTKKAMNEPHPLSPVEEERARLPKGNGDFQGFDYVYSKIASACELMATKRDLHLSDEHVRAMAILGCGHEETMKAELMRLRDRGFIA